MRAVLVCPNPILRTQLEACLANFNQVAVSKVLREYPSPDAFRRLLRVSSPDVVLLSIEDLGQVEQLNPVLDEFPSIPRVAIAEQDEQAALRIALRLRMTELITPPFEISQVSTILAEVRRLRELHPEGSDSQNQFCAFMPVKGGVGASTIAANVACAFGEMPENNVLLADFDVHTGMAGFLFNVEHEFGLCDAAFRNKVLDDDSWRRLTCRKNNVDLLLSSPTTPAFDHSVQDQHVAPILDFAHRNYSVVCADICDSFEDRSLSVLREATKIFVVTTPDLAALRMARLKAMTLRKLEWHEKASLVVNRVTKSMELSLAEIERTVGLPLFATFPSEYNDVTNAARLGIPAPRLQVSSREFAHKLLGKKLEPKRTGFMERFAVTPARFAFR